MTTTEIYPSAQDNRWARLGEARLYQVWNALNRRNPLTVVEVNRLVGLSREQSTSERLKTLAGRGLAENLSTDERRHAWVQRGHMPKPPPPATRKTAAAVGLEPDVPVRSWQAVLSMPSAVNGGLAAVGFTLGDHPGMLLGWWLDDHHEDHMAFSRRLGIVGPNINQIVNGQRAIGFIVALRLEDGTGIPTDVWTYLWSAHQRAVVEASFSPRRIPVDIEMVTANSLSDRPTGAYWSCDVGGQHLDGVVAGPLDVPAAAQTAISDRVGLRYWEFQLELSIDGELVTRHSCSPAAGTSVAPRIIEGARKRAAAKGERER